jgi:hypothetical protein
MTPLRPTRRVANWAVVLLVGALAVAALATALTHDEPATSAAQASPSSAPPCRLSDLSLVLRIAAEPPHLVSLVYLGAKPCDLGHMGIFVSVTDRSGQGVIGLVAPREFRGGVARREFSGLVQLGDELDATWRYVPRCSSRGPYAATIEAKGEIGSLRASGRVNSPRRLAC